MLIGLLIHNVPSRMTRLKIIWYMTSNVPEGFELGLNPCVVLLPHNDIQGFLRGKEMLSFGCLSFLEVFPWVFGRESEGMSDGSFLALVSRLKNWF